MVKVKAYYILNSAQKYHRFIQQIKDRTECFDDNFPCKIIECKRKHVNNWKTISHICIWKQPGPGSQIS
jgi:hypothetical protein